MGGDRATNEPVLWGQGRCSFYYDDVSGGCADHNPPFAEYVRKLRPRGVFQSPTGPQFSTHLIHG